MQRLVLWVDGLFGWADDVIVFLAPVLKSRCLDAHDLVAKMYRAWEKFSKEIGLR